MKEFENVVWSNPKYGAPIVKISDYGIVFNGATIELLNNPQGIKMGYNLESNMLLIKPIFDNINTDDNDNNVYKFSGRKKDGGHSIRIGNKRFIKYISSKLGKDLTKSTNKFPANFDKDSGLLLVDLNMELDDIQAKEENKVKKLEEDDHNKQKNKTNS